MLRKSEECIPESVWEQIANGLTPGDLKLCRQNCPDFRKIGKGHSLSGRCRDTGNKTYHGNLCELNLDLDN